MTSLFPAAAECTMMEPHVTMHGYRLPGRRSFQHPGIGLAAHAPGRRAASTSTAALRASRSSAAFGAGQTALLAVCLTFLRRQIIRPEKQSLLTGAESSASQRPSEASG